jgi:hypothetical protein
VTSGSTRPSPGWSSDIWDEWRRSSLPAQDTGDNGYVPSHHICGVGGEPKPGHADYRCCRCGQWYWWSGRLWKPSASPGAEWLRSRGLGEDAEDFWDFSGDGFHGGFSDRPPSWLRRAFWGLLSLRRNR